MEPRRRFKFLKELASGGFGKVYLAEMITGDDFSSAVAIKVLHARWTSNHEVVSRSRDEARLLGRLRHANIVRVEDLTAISGQCAVVMEYLDGVDVRTVCTWLQENLRVFPRQALFEVVSSVASALDAAYNAVPPQGGVPLRVIHRDIKPSNVMVTVEGDVKVLDFGTARASFAGREAQTEALAFGSAAFMAPERHMGAQDTPATDIFSLGITMYEMLTCQGYGQILVHRERFEETLEERLGDVQLDTVPAEVRGAVLATLRAMLSWDVEQRPTAAQVVERMDHYADATRDGGVRRFAREIVRPLARAQAHVQDPRDPLTGSVVFEDTGPPSATPRIAPPMVWTDPPPAANETAPVPPPVAPVRAASILDDDDPPPPRTSTGLVLQVAAGLVALGLLAAFTAGGIWYLALREPPTTHPGTVTGTPSVAARTGLPAGTADPEWRRPGPGKGGALLRAPGGASDVSINSTAGFKADWNGSGWLRLGDLEPGLYRSRAVTLAGDTVRGDFQVDAGAVCVWTLLADGSWERGECR